jgi:hypothetical protein
MVILRATSILRGQNEDKGMMCNITHNIYIYILFILFYFFTFCLYKYYFIIKSSRGDGQPSPAYNFPIYYNKSFCTTLKGSTETSRGPTTYLDSSITSWARRPKDAFVPFSQRNPLFTISL